MMVPRALLLILLCLLVAAPVSAAKSPVQVSLSRAEVSTRIGESFGFDSEIRNTGTRPRSGIVASLNVVGLSSGIYVDPEDWSEDRTKFLSPLAPGESTSVGWNVKAVTGGRAAIYVVVLPGRSEPAVSPAMDVRISETKDLNSGGVLPLALGVPAFLGAIALLVRRRRR
jgi:uncharacterized membrane protein